jgi:hypothetical protein
MPRVSRSSWRCCPGRRGLDEQVRSRRTDGLFQETGRVAGLPAGIPARRGLFDSLLANVIMHPERYRVIVTPNEYGDFRPTWPAA